MARIAACIVTALLAAAPATVPADIAAADAPVVATGRVFTVQIPQGWVYERSARRVDASRDGYRLNAMFFELLKHDKAFTSLKKSSTPDMPAEELADSYVADFKQRTGVDQLEVLSLEPSELAGQPGFRLHLRFRTAPAAGAAQYESVVLGAATGHGLLLAGYAAPRLNYFAKSIDSFERSLQSLTLAP